MEQNNDIQSAINAGAALNTGKVIDIHGTPALVAAPGHTVHQFKELRERPERIAKTLKVTSHKSFVEYFNRFADEDSTIFIDYEKKRFVGELDYHQSGLHDNEGARHCAHKVSYDCPLTPEAMRWIENDGKPKSQFDFAQFIESGAPEIIEPQAAEMLEVALTLAATNSVNFRSAVRLQNGAQQFKYEENVQGQAGVAGQLEIPSKIALALKLFRGDEVAYRIEANFRYRIKEGQLVLWYELIRPHVALEDAVKAIAEKIEAEIKTGHIIEANT